MLKVLVDEDLRRSTAAFLQSLSIDARDVRDVGLKEHQTHRSSNMLKKKKG